MYKVWEFALFNQIIEIYKMAKFAFVFHNKQTPLSIWSSGKSVDVITKASLFYYALLFPKSSLQRQVIEIVVKM